MANNLRKALKEENYELTRFIVQAERKLNLCKARLMELVKQKMNVQKELHKDDFKNV